MLPSRMQGRLLLLQRGTVPLPQLRRSVVGALRKVEKDFIRLFSCAHPVVRQYKFAQFDLVESRIRLNFRLCEPRRFWISIGIEDWRRRSRVAGPKTETANFLRVGLARDLVRQMRDSSRMGRGWPPGETRHRQIKTAPEKMHRTALATETRAKFLKDAIALHEHTPKPVRIFGVIRAMFFILVKGDRIFNLVRRGVDYDRQLEIAQCLHHDAIKLGNRFRFQRNDSPRAIALVDEQLMIGEIRRHLESMRLGRDRWSR